MATQNPVEYEGTYPLPEAQLDRFYSNSAWVIRPLMRSWTSYLFRKKAIRLRHLNRLLQRRFHPFAREVQNVRADDSIKEYIVEIVQKTRQHGSVQLGVSPRGSIALMKAAQAYALRIIATMSFRMIFNIWLLYASAPDLCCDRGEI